LKLKAEGKGPTVIARALGKSKPEVKRRLRSFKDNSDSLKKTRFLPAEVIR